MLHDYQHERTFDYHQEMDRDMIFKKFKEYVSAHENFTEWD